MIENTSQKLILRRPLSKDIPEIEDLGKASSHPLPDRFLDAAVIEKNKDVIALGVTRSILEALLYSTGSDRDKVESLKQLIRQAKTDGLTRGCDSIYVFAESEEFAKILEKHFEFRRLNSIPMMLDL